MKTDATSFNRKAPEAPSAVPLTEQSSKATRYWHRIALGSVLLISGFLNFFQLDRVGDGNIYYTAAVKSMLTSWHNFFFVSFDPGGFVSVDKPPLGLWLQALSAKLFGLSGVSVILPEALAGVAAVAILYSLVRRVLGPIAGLLAALALALTPISVAANRDNIVDSVLVLLVLLAAWTVSLAAETGRLRWLLLCAAFVGLGFNVKALQAYLVIPAFGLMYLLGAPTRWRTRFLHLFLALLVLLVVSFSWSVLVDLTPASQRPYVGSSQTNSELELAFGYNGLQRITGNIFARPSASSSNSSNGTAAQQNQGGQNGFTPDEGGIPGPLRLFNQQLGGQVSWLLPFALLSLVVVGWLSWRLRPRLPLDAKQQALVLWGTWLLTMYVFFSIAGFFHQYYLTMLSPAISALTGIGMVFFWQDYQRPGWRGWLLPAALVGTAAVQAYLLSPFPDWRSWLLPLVISLCLLVAGILVVARLKLRWRTSFLIGPVVTAGLLSLLIAPTVWSAVTVDTAGGLTPTAGPTLPNSPFGGFAGRSTPDFADGNPKLEQYLLSNQGTAQFLVATTNATSAAPIILDTGKPVMAFGGFLGSDPILTQQQLITLISNGTVRFFLTQGMSGPISIDEIPPQIRKEIPPQLLEELTKGGFGGIGGANSTLTTWVSSHCHAVPTTLWQSASVGSGDQGQPPLGGPGQGQPSGGSPSPGGGTSLYDCASHS